MKIFNFKINKRRMSFLLVFIMLLQIFAPTIGYAKNINNMDDEIEENVILSDISEIDKEDNPPINSKENEDETEEEILEEEKEDEKTEVKEEDVEKEKPEEKEDKEEDLHNKESETEEIKEEDKEKTDTSEEDKEEIKEEPQEDLEENPEDEFTDIESIDWKNFIKPEDRDISQHVKWNPVLKLKNSKGDIKDLTDLESTTIKDGDKLLIEYNWELRNDFLMIFRLRENDYAVKELPDIFESQEKKGLIGFTEKLEDKSDNEIIIGAYKIKDRTLYLKFFKEMKKLTERHGVLDVELDFKFEEIKFTKEEKITYGDNLDKEIVFEYVVDTSNFEPLEKKGTEFDEENKEISWIINLNKDSNTIDEAIIKDKLPDGLELSGDIEIYKSKLDDKGRVIDLEQYEKISLEDEEIDKSKIDINLGKIDSSYQIRYKTIIIGDSVDNKYTNNAGFYNGDSLIMEKSYTVYHYDEIPLINKKVKSVNTKSKNIVWEIYFNNEEKNIENIIIEDLIPIGLKYKNHKVYGLEEDEDYSIENIKGNSRKIKDIIEEEFLQDKKEYEDSVIDEHKNWSDSEKDYDDAYWEYYEQKERESAIVDEHEKAVENEKDYDDAYWEYYEKKERESAIVDEHEKAVENEKDYDDTYWEYYEKKERDSAIVDEHKKAIENEKDYNDAYWEYYEENLKDSSKDSPKMMKRFANVDLEKIESVKTDYENSSDEYFNGVWDYYEHRYLDEIKEIKDIDRDELEDKFINYYKDNFKDEVESRKADFITSDEAYIERFEEFNNINKLFDKEDIDEEDKIFDDAEDFEDFYDDAYWKYYFEMEKKETEDKLKSKLVNLEKEYKKAFENYNNEKIIIDEYEDWVDSEDDYEDAYWEYYEKREREKAVEDEYDDWVDSEDDYDDAYWEYYEEKEREKAVEDEYDDWVDSEDDYDDAYWEYYEKREREKAVEDEYDDWVNSEDEYEDAYWDYYNELEREASKERVYFKFKNNKDVVGKPIKILIETEMDPEFDNINTYSEEFENKVNYFGKTNDRDITGKAKAKTNFDLDEDLIITKSHELLRYSNNDIKYEIIINKLKSNLKDIVINDEMGTGLILDPESIKIFKGNEKVDISEEFNISYEDDSSFYINLGDISDSYRIEYEVKTDSDKLEIDNLNNTVILREDENLRYRIPDGIILAELEELRNIKNTFSKEHVDTKYIYGDDTKTIIITWKIDLDLQKEKISNVNIQDVLPDTLEFDKKSIVINDISRHRVLDKDDYEITYENSVGETDNKLNIDFKNDLNLGRYEIIYNTILDSEKIDLNNTNIIENKEGDKFVFTNKAAIGHDDMKHDVESNYREDEIYLTGKKDGFVNTIDNIIDWELYLNPLGKKIEYFDYENRDKINAEKKEELLNQDIIDSIKEDYDEVVEAEKNYNDAYWKWYEENYPDKKDDSINESTHEDLVNYENNYNDAYWKWYEENYPDNNKKDNSINESTHEDLVNYENNYNDAYWKWYEENYPDNNKKDNSINESTHEDLVNYEKDYNDAYWKWYEENYPDKKDEYEKAVEEDYGKWVDSENNYNNLYWDEYYKKYGNSNRDKNIENKIIDEYNDLIKWEKEYNDTIWKYYYEKYGEEKIFEFKIEDTVDENQSISNLKKEDIKIYGFYFNKYGELEIDKNKKINKFSLEKIDDKSFNITIEEDINHPICVLYSTEIINPDSKTFTNKATENYGGRSIDYEKNIELKEIKNIINKNAFYKTDNIIENKETENFEDFLEEYLENLEDLEFKDEREKAYLEYYLKKKYVQKEEEDKESYEDLVNFENDYNDAYWKWYEENYLDKEDKEDKEDKDYDSDSHEDLVNFENDYNDAYWKWYEENYLDKEDKEEDKEDKDYDSDSHEDLVNFENDYNDAYWKWYEENYLDKKDKEEDKEDKDYDSDSHEDLVDFENDYNDAYWKWYEENYPDKEDKEDIEEDIFDYEDYYDDYYDDWDSEKDREQYYIDYYINNKYIKEKEEDKESYDDLVDFQDKYNEAYWKWYKENYPETKDKEDSENYDTDSHDDLVDFQDKYNEAYWKWYEENYPETKDKEDSENYDTDSHDDLVDFQDKYNEAYWKWYKENYPETKDKEDKDYDGHSHEDLVNFEKDYNDAYWKWYEEKYILEEDRESHDDLVNFQDDYNEAYWKWYEENFLNKDDIKDSKSEEEFEKDYYDAYKDYYKDKEKTYEDYLKEYEDNLEKEYKYYEELMEEYRNKELDNYVYSEAGKYHTFRTGDIIKWRVVLENPTKIAKNNKIDVKDVRNIKIMDNIRKGQKYLNNSFTCKRIYIDPITGEGIVENDDLGFQFELIDNKKVAVSPTRNYYRDLLIKNAEGEEIDDFKYIIEYKTLIEDIEEESEPVPLNQASCSGSSIRQIEVDTVEGKTSSVNVDARGTGNRPEDLIDFTIEKLGENNEKLSGAVFRLRKKDNSVIKNINSGKSEEKVKIIEKSTDSEGKISFKYIPIGDYIIEEVAAPKGYKKIHDIPIKITRKEIKGQSTELISFSGKNISVKNEKLAEDKIEITAEKKWENIDLDKLDIDTVEVQLMRNGQDFGEKVELNKKDNWKYIFKDLDKVDKDGEDYNYNIKELNVPKDYKSTVKDFTIINTYTKEEPEEPEDPDKPVKKDKISITAEKKWENIDLDKLDIDTVEVQLMRDGKDFGEKVELNKKDNWKYIFKDLDKVDKDGKDYNYTIKEISKFEDYNTNISYTGNKINIVNTYIKEEPEEPEDPDKPVKKDKIEITAEKKWENIDLDKLDIDTVEVQLMRNGKDFGEKVELNKKDNWKYIFKDLDKADKDGKDYNYTIKEISKFEDYNTNISYTGNKINIVNTYIKEEPEEPEDPDKPVKKDKIEITAEKKWENIDLDKLDIDTVEIQLMRDGKDFGEKVELNKKDNWKYIFKDLDKADKDGKDYNYTIKEISKFEDYNTNISYTGNKINIVNTYIKEEPEEPEDPDKPVKKDKIEITAEKKWENIDLDKLDIDTVEIQLMRDGKDFGEKVELNKKDNWKYIFKDLDKADKDGKDYNYTIKEISKFEDYNTNISYTGNKINIVNTYIKEDPEEPEDPDKPVKKDKISITAEKKWENIDLDKLDIDTVEIQLMRDGKDFGEKVELNKKDNWKYIFKDLDKADKDGKDYNYTIKEISKFEDYNTNISYTGNKINIVNTYIKEEPEDPDTDKPIVEEPEDPDTDKPIVEEPEDPDTDEPIVDEPEDPDTDKPIVDEPKDPDTKKLNEDEIDDINKEIIKEINSDDNIVKKIDKISKEKADKKAIKSSRLPKTGVENNIIITLIGLGLISIGGYYYLKKKKDIK